MVMLLIYEEVEVDTAEHSPKQQMRRSPRNTPSAVGVYPMRHKTEAAIPGSIIDTFFKRD